MQGGKNVRLRRWNGEMIDEQPCQWTRICFLFSPSRYKFRRSRSLLNIDNRPFARALLFFRGDVAQRFVPRVFNLFVKQSSSDVLYESN